MWQDKEAFTVAVDINPMLYCTTVCKEFDGRLLQRVKRRPKALSTHWHCWRLLVAAVRAIPPRAIHHPVPTPTTSQPSQQPPAVRPPPNHHPTAPFDRPSSILLHSPLATLAICHKVLCFLPLCSCASAQVLIS